MASTARQPQRRAPRREQILEAARERFAANGIGAVTMGDIASTAGVSPGNLYYWFRQKSDVVNALFDEWSRASQPAVSPADPPHEVLAFLWERESLQQRVTAHYDFFARDLLPLLHSDPDLRDRYRANYQAGMAGLHALFRRVIDAGLLRDDVDVDSLLRVGWMASEIGGPWTEIVDPDGDPVRHTRALMSLALTPSGRASLESHT